MKKLLEFLEENNLEMFPTTSDEGAKTIIRIRFHDVVSGDVAEMNYSDPNTRTKIYYPKHY